MLISNLLYKKCIFRVFRKWYMSSLLVLSLRKGVETENAYFFAIVGLDKSNTRQSGLQNNYRPSSNVQLAFFAGKGKFKSTI